MKSIRDRSISRIIQIMDQHEYTDPSELLADIMHYCDWMVNDREVLSHDIELVVDKAWSHFYNDAEFDEQLNFTTQE